MAADERLEGRRHSPPRGQCYELSDFSDLKTADTNCSGDADQLYAQPSTTAVSRLLQLAIVMERAASC